MGEKGPRKQAKRQTYRSPGRNQTKSKIMGVGKMDSCCCSLNKYIIWAANFAVFALACASLGVGIYALVDGEGLSDFLDQLQIDEDLNIIYLGSILIIVVSSFVLLITFLG